MEEAEEVLEFVEAMEGACLGRGRGVRVGGVSVLIGVGLGRWERLGCGWAWPWAGERRGGEFVCVSGRMVTSERSCGINPVISRPASIGLRRSEAGVGIDCCAHSTSARLAFMRLVWDAGSGRISSGMGSGLEVRCQCVLTGPEAASTLHGFSVISRVRSS